VRRAGAAYPGEPEFSQDRRNALPPARHCTVASCAGSTCCWFRRWPRLPPLAAELLLDDGADLSAYGVDAHTVLLPGHAPACWASSLPRGRLHRRSVRQLHGAQPADLPLRPGGVAAELRAGPRPATAALCTVGHGEPFSGDRWPTFTPPATNSLVGALVAQRTHLIQETLHARRIASDAQHLCLLFCGLSLVTRHNWRH